MNFSRITPLLKYLQIDKELFSTLFQDNWNKDITEEIFDEIQKEDELLKKMLL